MDARSYRTNRHLPALGNENNIPPAGKTLHRQHKPAGNLPNMPVVGNFNVAAKRTALGDRNVAPRDAGDARCDGKAGIAQNSNATSNIVTSKAQENRIQAKPMTTLRKAFFQPAQRPSRTIAPSVSMSQIGTVSNNAHGLRKAFSRASMSSFVYKDPQQESKAAPAGPARAVPADGLVAQATAQVQPAAADTGTKQELLIDLTSPKLESAQPERYKPQDCQQPSHRPAHKEVRRQRSTQWSPQSSLLAPLDGVPSPDSPPADDDDVTEPLYLDAVEDFSQEQIQFLTNAPAQFLDAPQPQQLVVRSQPEPRAPERVNLTRTSSGAQPEIGVSDAISHHYHPSSVSRHPYQPYPSDCDDDDDEDYYYDDRGYTTAHSYRSRGDNTTGGVTTVMFPPKITKKGQAEIEAARQIVESRRTAEDIQEDALDVSMVAEYGEEIFSYMREQEMNLLPNPHYMDNQGEIQWSMRSVLMDWVVQVHTRFGLLPETLFLTVNYIDRFLSHKIVSLGKLQLVGATAIFIAAKYEEINCPSVQEIVYMVDSGYTVEEILKAERFMLSMLDFELGWPGPMSFLRRISKADDYDLETRTLAKYFLEVVIMDERFVASPPSYIAAGAHCLSRLILRKGEWTPSHVHYSGYTYHQLKPLVTLLLDCCRHARKHHSAVFEKYSDKRYRHASTYVEEEIMRGYTLPFEQRVSMSFSVEFFSDEVARASYAGAHPTPHATKMPIPTHG
ncbi:putative G2 mitotic-specific cyclin [Rosellinia necatrix]|uniref:Putative G2 mitotic-specific cyclin n=1 Tax=Rosellinia necatrix TaxID=77044 RepID=A0A1S7ULD5_ROSNE|nr:putative G2 mitotic-specific cyclin [Rosellinia necatrix]